MDDKRELHHGIEDGFEPLEPLDVRRTDSFARMLEGMSKTAFTGRQLGEAYDVLLAMARDPDCRIVVTLSGAMTIAKMGRVLCEMIEHGLAHYIVSTGALMAHGLTEAIGCAHFKVDPSADDEELYAKGYDRVYDTLELEVSLNTAQDLIAQALDAFGPDQPTCSHLINGEIGRLLAEQGQMPSILGCAFKHGVKVYVPAFTDSELGLDMAVHAMERHAHQAPGADMDTLWKQLPAYNPFMDLNDYAREIMDAKRLGIFTIGGGVPRNWAQQIAPTIDNINRRLGRGLRVPRIQYAVRICPEPVHWGGLSGCTYSEGVSWGKFVPIAEGGRFAEVLCDATVAWPILIRGVLESLGRV